LLAELIQCFRPTLRVIVSLGKEATKSVLRIAGKEKLANAAFQRELLPQLTGEPVLECQNQSPVYLWAFKHPSWGDIDRERWAEFGEWLRSHKFVPGGTR
jgi:uracil-DNA glycosylase